MEGRQSERLRYLLNDSASHQNEPSLPEALERLKSASALLSAIIGEELTGNPDRDMLESLYAAKGAVTCAVEETQKRISQPLYNGRKLDGWS
nr:hypothetical protein [Sphingomonas sp.]